MNPGRRGGKPVTNRLSYGTAFDWKLKTGKNASDIQFLKQTLLQRG
jgi:hypothetical protein